MNNSIKFILIGLLFIFLLVFVRMKWLNWTERLPCPQPERPTGVPYQAVWKGGCDGGLWIQLLETKENKFRFKIYHDFNGELLLDADFILENCDDFILSETNWKEYITWYSGQFIGIKNLVDSKNWKCKLRPIFPAYAGKDWEIMKENKEY